MNYDDGPWVPRPVDTLPPGMSRRLAIEMKCCLRCGGEAEVFSDWISEREYHISGYCQSCQDYVFQDGED